MTKIDYKKLDIYQAKKNQFKIINIPKLQYLMVDGHGDPNTSKEFVYAIEALYAVAYTLKFTSKISLGKDYVVPPLEGLWWASDMSAFMTGDKASWDWTLMIMVPDWINQKLFKSAVEKVLEKKTPASIDKLRLETFDEGKSVQTLYVGPYDGEAEILSQMHNEFIPNNKLKMVKKHHEIYLGDPRRVAPEKLRTILRQPVMDI